MSQDVAMAGVLIAGGLFSVALGVNTTVKIRRFQWNARTVESILTPVNILAVNLMAVWLTRSVWIAVIGYLFTAAGIWVFPIPVVWLVLASICAVAGSLALLLAHISALGLRRHLKALPPSTLNQVISS